MQYQCCQGKGRAEIQKELDALRERLAAYRARELEILNGGVQSYGIGSRNVSRYGLDIGAIRDAIKDLEQQIAQIQNNFCSPPAADGPLPLR